MYKRQPQIRVADCRYNAEQIFTLMREADKQGVRVLALPELCLTGYTCGDLFLQDTLLRGDVYKRQLLGLLNALEVGVQLVLLGEGDTVDALEGLAAGVAPPVGGVAGGQLDGVALDPAGGVQVEMCIRDSFIGL